MKIIQAEAAVVVVSLYAVYIAVRTIPNHRHLQVLRG
jgi:hypothetical protein